MGKITIAIVILVLAVVGIVVYKKSRQFKLPKGETTTVEITSSPAVSDNVQVPLVSSAARKILVTGGVKHSVPLDEILAGGPPKDGIPSIDKPKFITTAEADKFVKDEEAGQGLCLGGECRFYPYQILVWHEIVNDVVGGQPALVTYCPLCATGIVYEPKLEGKTVQFGTSGKLWQSNLVMYNRTGDPKKESLWSQVLGEAIVGEFTGSKLTVISSDVIKYGNWKKLHSNTKVLSKDTGFTRAYGYDPYGDYYTSNQVSFGASFTDRRLGPKEFVLGIQVNGKFKAYQSSALKTGETKDTFNNETIFIAKNSEGEVRMFTGVKREPLPYIGGFWFSWAAVHPQTELYK